MSKKHTMKINGNTYTGTAGELGRIYCDLNNIHLVVEHNPEDSDDETSLTLWQCKEENTPLIEVAEIPSNYLYELYYFKQLNQTHRALRLATLLESKAVQLREIAKTRNNENIKAAVNGCLECIAEVTE